MIETEKFSTFMISNNYWVSGVSRVSGVRMETDRQTDRRSKILS